MVGQENFIDNFKLRYSLSNLPHSVILLGDYGSGHVDVCREISEYYGLDFYDITGMINTNYINLISTNNVLSMYVINLSETSEKEQNTLLKVFEEPNPYTYIYLYGESMFNVLETIATRSIIMNLDKYSREYLKGLILKEDYIDLILETCKTPGQIETANYTDIKSIVTLCKNMIEKLGIANFANTLTISDKINFSGEAEKFDLRFFLDLLLYFAFDSNRYDMYNIISRHRQKISYMNDKKSYFEHMLIELWKKERYQLVGNN